MGLELDWPYAKIEQLEGASEPSWACPDRRCLCAPIHGEAGFEFSIMLCEASGERMPSARCRVVMNGILMNRDQPHADAQGWITVTCRHRPETVLVEWAPQDTPLTAAYPYRRRYYVELPYHDFAEAGRRRLHNLGFSFLDTLSDNVRDFQIEYGHPEVTGELLDIQADLLLFHDAACVPVTDRQRPREHPGSIILTAGGDAPPAKAPPQPPPSPPPTTGQPKTGSPLGQGTAQQQTTPSIHLPTVIDALDAGTASFSFWGIDVEVGDYIGIFYVFVDALIDTRSGLRLPCRAAESQIAANRIEVRPRDLAPMGWLNPPDADPLPCLLLTAKLMDARWENAARQNQWIEPCLGDVKGLLSVEARKLNQCVNAKKGSTFWAADSGKAWILSHRLGDKIGGMHRAINYGWHVHPSQVDANTRRGKSPGIAGTPVSRAATPGQWVMQPEAGAHDAYHIDYSQLLFLVAGWCQVILPGEDTPRTFETRTVYQDKELCRLVDQAARPLKLVEQPFDMDALRESQRRYREDQETRFRRQRAESHRGSPTLQHGGGT